jgi:hypothetical protein
MGEQKRPGFWKRQFTGGPSRWQNRYDVAFGIVMPLLCLAMDPVVFRGPPFFPILKHYSLLAYTVIACAMTALALWLSPRRRPGNGSRYFAGPLLAGGLFALTLHAVMLPLTVRAMVVAIGVLGFTPFLTSFVYFRNAWRAWAEERDPMTRGSRIGILLGGMLLMLLPSLGVLYWGMGESLRDLLRNVVSGNLPKAILFEIR